MNLRMLGLLLAGVVIASPAAQALPAQPAFGPWGYDLTAFDRSTKPGDDFFQFANGSYLARTPIPGDRAIASRRYDQIDRTEEQLRLILEDASSKVEAEPLSTKGKVGAFYKAFLDEPRIQSLGLKPFGPELQAIRQARDLPQLVRLMGSAPGSFFPSPFSVVIDTDLKAPKKYAIYIGQDGLGLPNRDYYLTAAFAKERTAYQAYAASLLNALGWPKAEPLAARIVELETALAAASWTKVQQRDLTTQYHAVTRDQLQKLAPDFPWAAFLAGAGIAGHKRFVVTTDTALPKLARVINKTPVPILQAWLAFRASDRAAPYLPARFVDAEYAFRGRVLSGQVTQRPRWKRGIAAVAGTDCVDASICFGTLNWAVGELYSARYFPPATKAAMEVLVGKLTEAFRLRLERLDWMSEPTKREALRKLATYRIKVGYPDRPRDYSTLRIRSDDLLGNVRRAAAANWRFYVARSTGPVDQLDWVMTPQTNNAYNGSLRDIVFPAAILQAPVYDPAADAAINFGAVGAIIGHELTHGFDDQGRSIDADGALRDWWQASDASRFAERARRLGLQYSRYEPVRGVFINPDLTMGENIADLGGFAMARDAYLATLGDQPAPILNGLTGEQRLFLGWAQAWAGKATDEEIKRATTSDPHSFRKFRVNGVVRNIDAWYEAFRVQPGQSLYLAPADRVRIW